MPKRVFDVEGGTTGTMLTILLAAVLSAPPEPKTITADDWLTEAGKMLEKAASIKDKAKREKLARAELAKFNAKWGKKTVISTFTITKDYGGSMGVEYQGNEGSWPNRISRKYLHNDVKIEESGTLTITGNAKLALGRDSNAIGWLVTDDFETSIFYDKFKMEVSKP